nr:MAG TPA: hypothetical protein [Caudoviricetes sp.]
MVTGTTRPHRSPPFTHLRRTETQLRRSAAAARR